MAESPAREEAAVTAAASTSGAKPGENTAGFLNGLGKDALKKIAYYVLQWIQKTVGSTDEHPGNNKKQEVSPSTFMSYLKDGTLLGKLANVLQPGAIETVHEKPVEKEKQVENTNNFLNFAKHMGGVSEGVLFKPDDIQHGKGFPNVLGTLLELGINSKEKFGQEGLSMGTVMQIATSQAGKNFFKDLMGKIFKK